jgi:hypothetical protein
MKATDIMVGDILWHRPSLMPVVVKSVHTWAEDPTDGWCYVQEIEPDAHYLDCTMCGFDMPPEEQKLKPFPISREFLEANEDLFTGIIKNDEGSYGGEFRTKIQGDVLFYYSPKKGLEVRTFCDDIYGCFRVNAVHELQHILRMTGNETKFRFK